MDKETEIAKMHLRNGDKRRALLAIKKKKFQESLLEKAEAHLENIEKMVFFVLTQQTSTIEFTQIEKQVFERLEKGTETLKELQKEMQIDKVEKLLEDTQDAIDYQNVA